MADSLPKTRSQWVQVRHCETPQDCYCPDVNEVLNSPDNGTLKNKVTVEIRPEDAIGKDSLTCSQVVLDPEPYFLVLHGANPKDVIEIPIQTWLGMMRSRSFQATIAEMAKESVTERTHHFPLQQISDGCFHVLQVSHSLIYLMLQKHCVFFLGASPSQGLDTF